MTGEELTSTLLIACAATITIHAAEHRPAARSRNCRGGLSLSTVRPVISLRWGLTGRPLIAESASMPCTHETARLTRRVTRCCDDAGL